MVAASSPDRPTNGAPTVLVVDDDVGMCGLLRRMLERAGFAVVTATHPQDALGAIREAPVRVVITDILMPDMDGIALLRTLLAEQPTLPVITVSGADGWAQHVQLAVHFGARATLRKPVSATELVRTVRRVLATEAKAGE